MSFGCAVGASAEQQSLLDAVIKHGGAAMPSHMSAYGHWTLVIVNVAVFSAFAFSFTKPKTARDWRSFGAFTAFLTALFAEMYGFPLTIYLLSGWLGRRYPGVDLLSHDNGHLWATFIGWRGDPHLSPIHLVADALIVLGFFLLARAWPVLYAAQQAGSLATTGPYATMRHPQYVAFAAILVGFLVEWPTLLTLSMFPVLLVMYWRLARSEEGEMRARFGAAYAAYAARTPAFASCRLLGRAAPRDYNHKEGV